MPQAVFENPVTPYGHRAEFRTIRNMGDWGYGRQIEIRIGDNVAYVSPAALHKFMVDLEAEI